MKICRAQITAVMLAAGLVTAGILTSGCGATTAAEAESKVAESTESLQQTASEKETATRREVVEEGMTPIYAGAVKDGVYEISVDSSSSMFKITSCRLTVENGAMRAKMTMGGTGYLKLYMGIGEEAVKASEQEYIPYVEHEDGTHSFEVPVEALDMGIACSAFSKNKEKWYDRELVFRSDSLPAEAFTERVMVTAESLKLEDGIYTANVTLGGGSGKASVKSPASLRVEDGRVMASIVWGSANYDYMKVDGEKYELINTEGNSTFEIPVAGFDRRLPVIADTIAMSQPHEIAYTLTFDSATLVKEDGQRNTESQGSLELLYANQFSVDYYEGGYAMITVKDTGRYLVVPEEKAAPQELPKDVTVIQRPLKNIYLVATSAMDLFRSLDGVEQITLSGTDASGWYVEEARQAMESGHMSYAGKYNAPDYELILSKECDLAVESTMIYHSPEVKEQLEKLGIPVLVERSSYESHPLGRMEWLKLYGVLLGKEELAQSCFEQQMKRLEEVMGQPAAGKTVAFFYISPNGYVNVRKSGDYVAKMIELAGGSYVPGQLTENDNALSTMNMQMEAFYGAAKDADYIIYNSTIDGELSSVEQLLSKSSLLADFKAVKEGNVWCTGKNLFQETMGLGEMILDIHRMLTVENPDPAEMTYLHPLQ